MPSLVTKSCSKVDLLCVMDFATTYLIKYSGHTQAILGIFEGSRCAKIMGKLQKRNAQLRAPCAATTSENHKKESPVAIQ